VAENTELLETIAELTGECHRLSVLYADAVATRDHERVLCDSMAEALDAIVRLLDLSDSPSLLAFAEHVLEEWRSRRYA